MAPISLRAYASLNCSRRTGLRAFAAQPLDLPLPHLISQLDLPAELPCPLISQAPVFLTFGRLPGRTRLISGCHRVRLEGAHPTELDFPCNRLPDARHKDQCRGRLLILHAVMLTGRSLGLFLLPSMANTTGSSSAEDRMRPQRVSHVLGDLRSLDPHL